jgi:hypothetical protein
VTTGAPVHDVVVQQLKLDVQQPVVVQQLNPEVQQPVVVQQLTVLVQQPAVVQQLNPDVQQLVVVQQLTVLVQQPAVVQQLNPAVQQLNPEVQQLNPDVQQLTPEVQQLNDAQVPLTNSVATDDVAAPAALLNTALNWMPFCPGWALLTVRIGVVTPVDKKLAPPLVDSSHRTEGGGLPVALALNEALPPAGTVTLVGCWVITGAFGEPPPPPPVTVSENPLDDEPK